MQGKRVRRMSYSTRDALSEPVTLRSEGGKEGPPKRRENNRPVQDAAAIMAKKGSTRRVEKRKGAA